MIWYDQIPIQKNANVKQNGVIYINQISRIKEPKRIPNPLHHLKRYHAEPHHNYAFNSDDVYALMSQESVMLGKPSKAG
jgi:hypothetical protein